MSDYYTPGGSNLAGNPYATRMAQGQREEFLANVRKARAAGGLTAIIEERRQERAELQDAGNALGFSCHGPWEDPLACMDNCETCPFWQYDEVEYSILMEYLAQREHETEKEQAEAEAEYVAEYQAWVLEMARAEAES